MKRALALLIALCLLVGSTAFAEDTSGTQTVDLEKDGLTILRTKTSGETDTMKYKVDYPSFEYADATLVDYLTKTVSDPLKNLKRESPIIADTTAYSANAKDYIRMSFAVSMDFPGILSLEASVGNRAVDKSVNETLFFYRIIDLNKRTELTIYDLFTEPREAVDTAIRNAVFAQKDALNLTVVTDASQVPAPNSYYLSAKAFRCLFAAGTVTDKATVVDIPWAKLGLTQSAVLIKNQPLTLTQPGATVGKVQDESADMAGQGETLTDDAAIATRLTANDWIVNDQTLHFAPDGSITDPTGGEPLFVSYTIKNGKLYLSSTEREDQGAAVSESDNGLSLVFDPETSDYETLELTTAGVTAQEQPQQDAAVIVQAQAVTPSPEPATAAPSANLATSTPMPMTGADADVVSFLAQGLWKQLGTDGNVYYQFMPDGKLLTIEVSPYTVSDGTVNSDAISGQVTTGGTAFTITQADGTQVGYVLNRSAAAISGTEFVTPTPTPVPTPTPTPSPTAAPTPIVTPSPTPVPTPTFSPYEQASQSAPTLAALGDASFAKRQTLKVYSAPDEASFRDAKAQVTTDETVSIFGVTGNWVLVSYKIGNGSRGRMGYIANTTLADAANVAQIAFTSIDMKLTKNAKATDDPLYGQTKLFDMKKDASIKLLAFLGTDWAYVETQYKSKVCRVFIPRSALIAE